MPHLLKNIVLGLMVTIIIALGAFAPIAFTPADESNPLSVQSVFAAEAKKSASWFETITGIDDLGAQIANLVLGFFGLAVWVAGILLNHAIIITVLEMGTIVQGAGGIAGSWVVLRDFANIAFIFIILAIGISIILRIDRFGLKSLLPKVIIVALLINFSLFFTSFIIDVSNILSINIYNQMTSLGIPDCQTNSRDVANPSACGNVGISHYFMRQLDLPTVYNPKALKGGDSAINATAFDQTGGNKDNLFLITIFGSIFFLITAFVFFAAAILLVIRFVVLIILLILSPIAFAAMILPQTSGYAEKWWRTLFSQAFFAPAYLLMILVVTQLIGPNGIFSGSLSGGDGNFATALATGNSSAAIVFLNFAIITAFMIASLVIAKNLGAYGSGMVIDWGHAARKWGQGFVGRNTLGRASRRVQRGADWLEKKIRTTALGKLMPGRAGAIGRTLGIGQRLKYGSKASLQEKATQRAERIEQAYTQFGEQFRKDPEEMAAYVKNLSGKAQANMYAKLSQRERAGLEEYLSPTVAQKLRSTLSRDDQEAVVQARAQRFKNNPSELSSYLGTLEEPLRHHVYGTMSARDRIALDNELDPALRTVLRNRLSPEELEKTEKAAREEAEARRNAEYRAEIDKMAEEAGRRSTRDPISQLYRNEEMRNFAARLSQTEARKLSHEARTSDVIIQGLRTAHLKDLMSEGNLTVDEIKHIKGVINGPAYPNQAVHRKFIRDPANEWFWN